MNNLKTKRELTNWSFILIDGNEVKVIAPTFASAVKLLTRKNLASITDYKKY